MIKEAASLSGLEAYDSESKAASESDSNEGFSKKITKETDKEQTTEEDTDDQEIEDETKEEASDDDDDELEKDVLADEQKFTANAEEKLLDDPPASVKLRYYFRTVQDEVGYFPGRVTVRCRMGSAIESLKKVIGNMSDTVILDFLHRIWLDYFLKINVDCWKNCFHGLLCHYLLLREIKTNKENEMWFLICNKPIRFGMKEFCLVTGLNCGPLPSDNQCMEVFKDGMDFVEKVKDYCFLLKKENEKKSLVVKDLLQVIGCRSKKFKALERVGCAALYIIHSILLAADDNKQVKENYLAWLVNPTFFASYPWGRVCFEFTLSSLKKDLHTKAEEWKQKVETSNSKRRKPQPYTVGGFAAAFMVWAYEAIDVFGVNLGKKSLVLGDAVPRIVRWHSETTPKRLCYDWYDDLISKNEPTKEEATTEWVRLFEDLVDEEDETIDKLVSELDKIDILGPLDDIDE